MTTQLAVSLPDIDLPDSELYCTCKNAHGILRVGIETCQKLCDVADSLDAVRKNILLRSALVYGCSTLDSVGKRLTKDCLEEVINIDEGAQKTFEAYISRQIKNEPEKILSRVLSKPDYRSELIKSVQDSVEGTSLQSYSQICELTARFGIITKNIILEPEAREIFNVRQQVIHELDMSPEGECTQRDRSPDDLKKQCTAALKAAANLINETHNKVHARPTTTEEESE